MDKERQFMQFFDTHADELFADCLRGGTSRSEALQLTETTFMKVLHDMFMQEKVQ